ncbi:unnamed protein product [Rotaria sordida]|uniref:Uncharacterized protein n=1 Tax=Rotaria sordida TaxID=392033 RepID=A0A819T729_9BILA|nr:unnamed protein product [Rotaria sordida]CAF1422921.1 unnamed protein product [Rotaria sordida]CAF1624824.1 unnamed protein product [Rotaria sordida]CAF4074892.1 unnamed protein product [Rotaria sordida]
MATNYSVNDTIIGYITNVSNENKKKKYFVKFTLLTENNEVIDGWIFSGVTGILSTPLGLALSNSLKNKTGIKLWGSLENNNNTSTFRMQSWSKHQLMNLNFFLQGSLNNITSIRNALTSNESNTIRISIIDIRPSENFTSQGITRTSTFILVGDETGTCYLLAINLLPTEIEIEKTYDATKIRRKSLNGSYVLSTTVDTSISLSTTSVTPNIHDVEQTLSMNLNDRKTIITTIQEVGEIQRIYNCSTCQGNLNEVTSAAALLFCEKCHRHVLKANVTLHIATTIVLKKNEENIILFVSDQILYQLLDIIGVTINMSNTDIAIAMMSSTNLVFDYSELRKELLQIIKTN